MFCASAGTGAHTAAKAAIASDFRTESITAKAGDRPNAHYHTAPNHWMSTNLIRPRTAPGNQRARNENRLSVSFAMGKEYMDKCLKLEGDGVL